MFLENLCFGARDVNAQLALPKVSAYTHMLVNQPELWSERSGAQYAQSHTSNQGLWRNMFELNTVWEKRNLSVFTATNTLCILVIWIVIYDSFVNKARMIMKRNERKCYMNATCVAKCTHQVKVWHGMFKTSMSIVSGGPAFVQQPFLIMQPTIIILKKEEVLWQKKLPQIWNSVDYLRSGIDPDAQMVKDNGTTQNDKYSG